MVVELTGSWTDEEIATFLRREDRFLKIGLSDMEAEKLAERMLMRDRPDSGDGRRICIECKHLVKGACRKRIDMVRTLLQRCDSFVIRG